MMAMVLPQCPDEGDGGMGKAGLLVLLSPCSVFGTPMLEVE